MLDFNQTGAIISLNPSEYLYLKLSPEPISDSFLYLPTFTIEDETLYFIEETLSLNMSEIKKGPQKPVIQWQKANKEEFFKDVKKIKEEIKNGSIQKAVPITYESSPLKNPWQDYVNYFVSQMLQQKLNSNQHFYAYWNPEEEEFLSGISPELLYEYKDGKIESMAIAGTKHEGKNTHLLDDKKELKEHQWVIEDIKEKLGEYGEVIVGETKTISSSSLEHLYTPIHCTPNHKIKAMDIIDEMHPSPALGCYPSDSFLINEMYSDEERRYFGAPFCYITNDYQKAIVAIRNIQIHSGKIWLYAGCGIIDESDEEKEWLELQAKLNTIKGLYE